MKKINLILLMALTIMLYANSYLQAQNNTQDVVYLKNGNIIKGMIIEQIPNVSIKIQTADRSLFVFKMDEIDKMTKEPVSGQQTNLAQTNPVQNDQIVPANLPQKDVVSLDPNFVYGKPIEKTVVVKRSAYFTQNGKPIKVMKALVNVDVCKNEIKKAIQNNHGSLAMSIIGICLFPAGYLILIGPILHVQKKRTDYQIQAVDLYNNSIKAQ
jgi:hypothetical protein